MHPLGLAHISAAARWGGYLKAAVSLIDSFTTDHDDGTYYIQYKYNSIMQTDNFHILTLLFLWHTSLYCMVWLKSILSLRYGTPQCLLWSRLPYKWSVFHSTDNKRQHRQLLCAIFCFYCALHTTVCYFLILVYTLLCTINTIHYYCT